MVAIDLRFLVRAIVLATIACRGLSQGLRKRHVEVQKGVPLTLGEGCPSTEVQRYFNGMLKMPVAFDTHKVSFRSCVSHENETVIADIGGAGSVQQFWIVTGMGNRPRRPKNCVYSLDALLMVIRVYVDGETEPSIEAPLGPLFGIHHNIGDNWGRPNPYGADNSLFKISENGAFTLVAPMPFARGIRITIQDESPDETVRMRIWSQVTYYKYDPRCPMPETKRLHAVYRMQDRPRDYPEKHLAPHRYRRSFHLAHGQGSGYLLGVTMGWSMHENHDTWFHNGAEMIILDHTTNPRVLKGTGGEDFFCTSCWFSGHHNFPDWGFMYGENKKFFSAYRWFVSDILMPFQSEFYFQYGANRDVMSAVVYWYQDRRALPVQKHIPPAQRVLGTEPLNNSLAVPAPTGELRSWSFSPTHNIKHWGHSHKEVDVHYDEVAEIAPVFGFVSIGEYYFPYGNNDGYPVNVFVWGRSTVVSPKKRAVRIMLTHDDAIEVFLNGDLIYNHTTSLIGFHTFNIFTELDKGTNEFIVKLANAENQNTRAFVLGMNLYYDSDRAKNLFIQPAGNLTVLDDACQ